MFKKEFRVLPSDITASIGPHICPDCYVIGREVREAFGLPDTTVKFDLAAEAERQLLTAGVRKISLNSRCTFHEPELFFSHRKNKTASRMMSIVRF